MPEPRWKLLALDLDGTLVGSGGEISRENIDAVHRAREAGIKVVVCTGRGLRECRRFLDAIGQTEPVAVAGGSIIADPVTGRTLHRFSMDPALVHDVVNLMHRHGHPALVLKDPAAASLDYLVVESEHRHPLDPVMHWWFDAMKVGVRHVQHLHEDEHPDHTVRIGVFGISTSMHRLVAELEPVVGSRGTYHNFPAVVLPAHRQRLGPDENFHILELFDQAGNKWSAVSHLAARWGIDPAHTAAIGDEVNDLAMIRGAGLGVAMGNAVPQVREAAARSTLHHDQHGVAHAIDRMLEGEW
jgi:hypothetical protein